MQTFIFLMIVIIAVCFILTMVILSQNPKGGGLSSAFGGSGGGQMFGVQRTNDFLDKATWTLGGLIVVLIITANVLRDNPYATKTNLDSVPAVELPALPVDDIDGGAVAPATGDATAPEE